MESQMDNCLNPFLTIRNIENENNYSDQSSKLRYYSTVICYIYIHTMYNGY